MIDTQPVAAKTEDERMSLGQCPECACLPNRHDNWGGPDGCTLTGHGVDVRLSEYQCRCRAEVDASP